MPGPQARFVDMFVGLNGVDASLTRECGCSHLLEAKLILFYISLHPFLSG